MSDETKIYDETKGIRKNEGKVALDLIPPSLLDEIGRILDHNTNVTGKYPTNNWRKGFEWSSVINSMMRHHEAFRRGEDYDIQPPINPDDPNEVPVKFLHIGQIVTNALMIMRFYETHPELDDRITTQPLVKRIGLDIDGVCAKFIEAYNKKFNITDLPSHWNTWSYQKNKEELYADKDFWLGIEPATDPSLHHFEPACYITSRNIPISWSEEWLEVNGFPYAAVVNTESKTKSEWFNYFNLDWFVDDYYGNYCDLTNNGQMCYLLSQSHNQNHSVGHKRISDLYSLLA